MKNTRIQEKTGELPHRLSKNTGLYLAKGLGKILAALSPLLLPQAGVTLASKPIVDSYPSDSCLQFGPVLVGTTYFSTFYHVDESTGFVNLGSRVDTFGSVIDTLLNSTGEHEKKWWEECVPDPKRTNRGFCFGD